MEKNTIYSWSNIPKEQSHEEYSKMFSNIKVKLER